MMSYWVLFIGIAVASWLVQMNLQNKFKKYSKIPTGNGMTGRDVALKMLHDNGIYDVQVTHTPGQLTDHYNPANKTVNLSEGVYESNSIMAAACRSGTRMWTRCSARTYVCSVENAQRLGAGSEFFVLYHDLGIAGRYSAVQLIPAIVVDWYHSVCYHHFVQLYHLAGGNQCK